MKRLFTFSILSVFILTFGVAKGQTTTPTSSTNLVNFQITYDAGTDRYTAWVVPRYNVPNSNNLSSQSFEYGGTAQFTIKSPTSFSVIDIQDVNGFWEKAPLRLGPGNPGQTWTGLDPAFNYFVIGKSSTETNYGPFTNGTPVRLFTFKGNGCFGQVSPLPPGDAFIQIARSSVSLNVANSFYSRSGQGAGGNVVPLEQFSNIVNPPADCRPIGAVGDSGTLLVGTSITVPVLTNDTNKGTPASTTNVTVSITNPPSSGTAVVNPNGTVTYTPPPTFTGVVSLTYTICDLVNTSSCSSAPVNLTVLPTTPVTADLWVRKVASRPISQTFAIGDLVSFTVLVMNLGPANATNVVVLDALPASLTLVSQSASKGTYNGSSGQWTVGSLSLNETATLVITTRLVADGVSLNEASIQSSDQIDTNLSNNYASACASVPIQICSGDPIQVSLPSQAQNVLWYRNGTLIQTGGTTLTITQGGEYTFISGTTPCPSTGCCPLIVIETNCCKPICLPITIRRVRR